MLMYPKVRLPWINIGQFNKINSLRSKLSSWPTLFVRTRISEVRKCDVIFELPRNWRQEGPEEVSSEDSDEGQTFAEVFIELVDDELLDQDDHDDTDG